MTVLPYNFPPAVYSDVISGLAVDNVSMDDTVTRSPPKVEVGLGETPRRLIRKLCGYSSLEKFGDAFDVAV